MVRIKDIELGIAREISRLWKEGPPSDDEESHEA